MIKKKDSTLRYSNCKRYSVAAGLKERMSWRWRCGCWLVLLWFLLFIFSPSARPCCILPHPFGLWSSSPCFPSWLCWDENGCCCCGVRGRLVLREAAGSGGRIWWCWEEADDASRWSGRWRCASKRWRERAEREVTVLLFPSLFLL
jgi:hypothetical protein